MRLKSIAQRYFNFSKPSSLKFTNEFRAKYEAISRILDANTALLAAAHADEKAHPGLHVLEPWPGAVPGLRVR